MRHYYSDKFKTKIILTVLLKIKENTPSGLTVKWGWELPDGVSMPRRGSTVPKRERGVCCRVVRVTVLLR